MVQIKCSRLRFYKDGVQFIPVTPNLDSELCTQCEECVDNCPTGAISMKGQIAIDVNLCTFCCSCIKTCPVTAFSIEGTPMEEKAQWLNTNCSKRKEPQLFF